MKIDRNTAKELLMDFARFDDGNVPENWFHQLTPKISRYLEAKYKNNLALGKPEPLAKNKQFGNVCECTSVRQGSMINNKWICCVCNKPILQT